MLFLIMKTAVITTGGLGTRLLTSTKESPKTMLPLFDKAPGDPMLRPLLELIFDNLYNCGFRKFCIIVGSKTKSSILNHMSVDELFIDLLKKRNNSYDKRFIKTLSDLYKKINDCEINWIEQSTPMGFGHALLTAKKFVDDDFILHAGDTYFPNYDFIPQLIKLSKNTQNSSCSLLLQSQKYLKGYGIAEIQKKKNVNIVLNVEEKPQLPKSNLAILPVYAFKPNIFDALKHTKIGYNKELQVTDAIKTLINQNEKVIALKMTKKWFDIGTPDNYFKALTYSYKQSKI
jgi:UTP--glucose-1-phosphate uridylyltransferase